MFDNGSESELWFIICSKVSSLPVFLLARQDFHALPTHTRVLLCLNTWSRLIGNHERAKDVLAVQQKPPNSPFWQQYGPLTAHNRQEWILGADAPRSILEEQDPWITLVPSASDQHPLVALEKLSSAPLFFNSFTSPLKLPINGLIMVPAINNNSHSRNPFYLSTKKHMLISSFHVSYYNTIRCFFQPRGWMEVH